MRSVTDFSFEPVFEIQPDLATRIVQLWTQHAGLRIAEAQRRLTEVILVVRYQQEVIGVATAYKGYLQQSENFVYLYRCFIADAHRAPALDTQLIMRAKELLEEKSMQEMEKKCVGLAVIVQNETIKKFWNQAVWQGAEMMYIGNTAEGNHIRISYFKNARI